MGKKDELRKSKRPVHSSDDDNDEVDEKILQLREAAAKKEKTPRCPTYPYILFVAVIIGNFGLCIRLLLRSEWRSQVLDGMFNISSINLKFVKELGLA